MVYAPVTVRDRELIDGGIVSTTNLDIAVNAGAKFIVVVNPLVPYVNDFKTKIRTLGGTRTRHVSDMGFPQIGYQVFKMVAYQRLHEMARQWEQRYPGVDIVLIEPEPDDELMFQTPIMSYASRVEIARHGFQSVTTQLAFGYPRFLEICKRHGIEISATRVRKVMKHFEAEQGKTRAWRKILEQTTGALLRQLGEDPAAEDGRARVGGGGRAAAVPRRARPLARARIRRGTARPWRYSLTSSRSCSASRLVRKSDLSILPWKIGTPISMHLEITSRRSSPASRASSVGVR